MLLVSSIKIAPHLSTKKSNNHHTTKLRPVLVRPHHQDGSLRFDVIFPKGTGTVSSQPDEPMNPWIGS